MDGKSLMELRLEGNARRRRSNGAAQQAQPTRKAARQERGAGSAAASDAINRGKSNVKKRATGFPIAVVPPSSKSNNNINKQQGRCSSAREQQRSPLQRGLPTSSQPMTSRIVFGRTCSTLPPPPVPTSQYGVAPLGSSNSTRRTKIRSDKKILDTPRPKPPMAVAHEQLELLLSRIEQGSEIMPTPAAPRRRKPPAAKAVRRQMEHPPPVPTVTPLGSARRPLLDSSNTMPSISDVAADIDAAGTAGDSFVPLTQNPQCLAPGKRQALLELLSRAEKHDQDIVNILRNEVYDAGDPSRDTMRQTLQMLPLAIAPEDSPYSERFWEGHRYLKERQKLHQQLQPNDLRYKEVQVLRSPNGKFFLSKSLEEELTDEKHVLDFIEAELERNKLTSISPEQMARQQQAMDERIELDKQKQQVSEWRARHRRDQLKRAEHIISKKLRKKNGMQMQLLREESLPQVIHLSPIKIEGKQQLQQQQQQEQQQVKDEIQQYEMEPDEMDADEMEADEMDEEDDDITPRPTYAIEAEKLSYSHNTLSDLLSQRQKFQAQCQRSNLYNNPKCIAPWKLFASITNTLSSRLTENADAELHRYIAGFIKDFVESESQMVKRAN